MVLQPDGKLLIYGSGGLARLNSNGSVDNTFSSGTGIDNGEIECITLLPDGKAILGGYFTAYNGTTVKNIIRINSNGSLDTSFNTGTSSNSDIKSCKLQPDGKLLIGGNFSTFNDVAQNRMARLNSNGSVDTSFNVSSEPFGDVVDIVVQPNGKILICGNFLSNSGQARNRFARLNSNGSLDTGFAPTGAGAALTGDWAEVYHMYILQDQKIMVAGLFDSYDGVAKGSVARLYAACATPAPAGETTQTINETATAPATIEDIVVTAQGTVQWYASEADIEANNPLPAGAELESGTTYYAMQTIGDCQGTESLAVTINIVLGSADFNLDTAVRFYPNPAGETLTILAPEIITGIKVYNLEGRLLIDQLQNTQNATINLSAIATGTYLVSAATGNAIINKLVVHTKN
jgi:uncharacterized delta-60 repeat protein